MKPETLAPIAKAYEAAVGHYLLGLDDHDGSQAAAVRQARLALETALKDTVEPVIVTCGPLAYGLDRTGKLLTFYKIIPA